MGEGETDVLAAGLTAEGIPVLSGIASTLRVVGKAMSYRDGLQLPLPAPAAAPAGMQAKWRGRLKSGEVLSEAESLTPQALARGIVEDITALGNGASIQSLLHVD